MAAKPRADWPNPGGAIPIKVIVVGDEGCGKTSLVSTYMGSVDADDSERSASMPFQVQSKTTGLMGHLCMVCLWDCEAGEEMDRLRPLAYHQADLFLLCFSVAQPESYESARAKWTREVRFHAASPSSEGEVRSPELVVVGLMADLREDSIIKARLAEKQLAPIQRDQGKSLAQQIGARCYLECSATSQQGVVECVEKAVTSVIPGVKKGILDAIKRKEEDARQADAASARVAAGLAASDDDDEDEDDDGDGARFAGGSGGSGDVDNPRSEHQAVRASSGERQEGARGGDGGRGGGESPGGYLSPRGTSTPEVGLEQRQEQVQPLEVEAGDSASSAQHDATTSTPTKKDGSKGGCCSVM